MRTLPIRIAIVGGGIGGAAAANALVQRGIEVQIYEQAPALTEVGAGIGLQPNGVRMLRRLGFGDELGRVSAKWLDTRFLRSDGSYIAPMWPPELANEIEFFGIHRADLLSMLVEPLRECVIKTDHRCVGVDQDQDQAVINFSNGIKVTADAVIAADGIHSVLRQYVATPKSPIASGSVAYRGVVSASTFSWPRGAMRYWLGLNKHFLVFPVRGGDLLNYVGFVPAGDQADESWSSPGNPEDLAREFAGWDPMVGAIIAKASTTFRWGLYDREPLSVWSCGRLTLLGDAAHPMLPHVGQGANQAFEDAVVLAVLLSKANRGSIPKALKLYESLRRERTSRVQLSARVNGARFKTGNGDVVARDRQLAKLWQERLWIWDHDAEVEAVTAASLHSFSA